MSPMSSEQRLHPAAFLVHAAETMAGALLPAAVIIVLNGPSLSTGTFYAVLGIGASLLAGYIRWRTTRYWWTDTSLHFRSGVFSPDEKVIPIVRISAVDDAQGIVQRLFGVLALHVQTAGGSADGEIVLRAVSRADAAALRAVLRHGDEPEHAEPAVGEWALTRGGLLMAALTGPQLGVVLPAIGAALATGGNLLNEGDADAITRLLPDSAHMWVLLGIASVALVLLASLLGAIVGFGGFRVRREPQRLRIRRGIVERRGASVAAERIHAVRVVEGALRRPFGLCAIRMELAGYASEPAVAQTLIPLCRRSDAEGILARLLPELPLPDERAAQRPPRRALRRYVTVPAVAGVLAGVLFAVAAREAGGPALSWLAPVALGALGALLGRVRYGAAAWWLDAGIAATRHHGLLARTTIVARAARTQSRALAESVTQRRARLASVRFTVASGARGRVAHLERPTAVTLFAQLGP